MNSDIKEVRKKKERAKELEGIDMSNIVSSTRRRSTTSFVPPPRPKIPVEKDGENTGDDGEDEEDDDDDNEDSDDSQSEESNEGKFFIVFFYLCQGVVLMTGLLLHHSVISFDS